MECDVVVVGAGLVGAAFALALKDSGLHVAVVENRPPAEIPDVGWDSRIYAISPGNAAFLERLGVWAGLDRTRIAPVLEMRVWGDERQARIDFSAYEAGVPELNFILESRLLQQGLWRELIAQESAQVLCPAQCAGVEWLEDGVVLRLQDGQVLESRLLVGADGAESWIRRQAGIAAAPRSYGQLGVVANFEAEHFHGDVARQWFRSDGVLAWLPLPGNRISIVWSVWEAAAQELLALPPEAFCTRVADAGGHALGALRLITPPAGFPLRIMRLESLVKSRLALIGDAAHNVHPLAGQGVNLGFQDARVLAEVLSGRECGRDCGDYLLLRRYDRARKEDILSMQLVTDGLQKLFNNDDGLLRPLRNFGLGLANRSTWLKNRLMAHALG